MGPTGSCTGVKFHHFHPPGSAIAGISNTLFKQFACQLDYLIDDLSDLPEKIFDWYDIQCDNAQSDLKRVSFSVGTHTHWFHQNTTSVHHIPKAAEFKSCRHANAVPLALISGANHAGLGPRNLRTLGQ